MKVLFDHNLSHRLATTLNGYICHDGHSAVALRDMFDTRVQDIEWIGQLGQQADEWIVITGDLRIARNKAERAAWWQAGLKGFFLKRGWLKSYKVHEQAARIILRWPSIEALANQVEPGACFEVPLSLHAKFKQLPV